jgi:hypothetical protein
MLVALNSQFEGLAGGEVFNGSGKTDILLRVDDRNAFIAELKIWRGPKSLDDAIDQLLSYLVWRDTKAALIVFIEVKDASKTIETARRTIVGHPRCLRELTGAPPDRFDYAMSSGDEGREIHLAFLPFVVQRPE